MIHFFSTWFWLAGLLLGFSSDVQTIKTSEQISLSAEPKMCGVNFVAPQFKTNKLGLTSLQQINANWIALTPFAYLESEKPTIDYPAQETYWGNRPQNMPLLIAQARAQQLQIMLKPHFWIRDQGWAGELEMSETNWQLWKENYEQFILKMARMAEEHHIEVFCIGVELKTAIKALPQFWSALIPKIRQVYSGQLTYAANWDHYEQIPFWSELDYIGIDAYFPLSEAQTPSIKSMVQEWKTIARKLKRFSRKQGKPIIVTEYGYRSCDHACWNQWEIEFLPDDAQVNLKAQINGYQAFYQALWHQEWLAGAFLWKWYAETEVGGPDHSNYTPQNKPAQHVISNWYGL